MELEGVPGVELSLRPLTREDGEGEEWAQWEVKVRHAHLEGAFCVDVKARDAEHARALLEAASELVTVVSVVPLAGCEGCETCLCFGGCGSASAEARELPRNVNVARWIGGLCAKLGGTLFPTAR